MKSELIHEVFNRKNEQLAEKIPVKKISKPEEEKTAEEKIPNRKSETEEIKPKGFFGKLTNAVLKFSIFMIFLGVPIFFTGFSYQGIAFEKQLYFYFWTLLALVAWASRGILEESLKIKRTPLDIPILFFWIIYATATIFSIDRWHSFWGSFGDPSRGLLSVSAVILFYYIFASNFSKKMFVWNLGAFYVSGALVSAVTALKFFNLHFLPDTWMKFVPTSLLGSIGSLGVLFSVMLILSIMIVLKLRMDEKTKPFLKNAVTAIILAVIVGEIGLIWSIGLYINWVGVFLGMGLFLVLTLSKYIKTSKEWMWLPMAVFVMLLIIRLIGPVGVFNIKNLPREVSPSLRISWDVAKETLKEKMILGTGPATYGYDFSRYQPKNFNASFDNIPRFYQGTGIVAELAPTTGVLGIIAFVILFLTFISVIFYLIKKARKDNNVYSLGFLAATTMIMTGSLISRADGSAILANLLVVILALTIIFEESEMENSFRALTLKASAKFALTMAFIFVLVSVGVVFMFIFIGKAFSADIRAYLGVKEIQSGNANAIEKINRATSIFGREGSYFILAGQEYMLLANDENAKKAENRDTGKIIDYVNRAMENSKKGSDLMPNDVQAMEALAQVYENVGLLGADTLQSAEEKYKKAAELEPHNPIFLVKLGQIKLGQAVKKKNSAEKKSDAVDEDVKKIIQEAKDLFQKSIDKKSNFSAGFFNLAIAKEALGEIDGAIGDMEKAASLESKNASYVFSLGRLYGDRGKEGDYKKAEVLFKRIIAAKIDEANARFSLGSLYKKMNRNDEAIAEYRKVLELIPVENVEARKKVEDAIGGSGNNAASVSENIESVENAIVPAENPQNTETENNDEVGDDGTKIE